MALFLTNMNIVILVTSNVITLRVEPSVDHPHILLATPIVWQEVTGQLQEVSTNYFTYILMSCPIIYRSSLTSISQSKESQKECQVGKYSLFSDATLSLLGSKTKSDYCYYYD